MDLNSPEFDKLIKNCRKNGIISVKSGDFSIEIAPSAFFPETQYKRKKAESVEEFKPTYTDEDALFWSSGTEG